MQPFHITIATGEKDCTKGRERKTREERGKNSVGSYWLLHELANWFCCDSLISTVCNDIPISSKHFPPQSSIIATQFRMCSCEQLIDRWTNWLNGRWCVCLCLLTESISSRESFDLVSHQPATEWDLPLNNSTVGPPQRRLKNWKSNRTVCYDLLVTLLRACRCHGCRFDKSFICVPFLSFQFFETGMVVLEPQMYYCSCVS